MPSEGALEYRFAVGSPAGPNSATVKVWTIARKSDVYIGVREAAGTVKVSLHESGQCFSGLTSETVRKEPSLISKLGGSRFQHEWMRRTHLGSQSAGAVHICFPSSELRSWRRLPPRGRDIDWLAAPLDGRSVIVHCVFSGSTRDDTSWPGKAEGLRFLRSHRLPNGEKLWLLAEDLVTTPAEIEMLALMRTKRESEPMVEFAEPAVSRGAGPRTLIFGRKKGFEGYFIIDAALD